MPAGFRADHSQEQACLLAGFRNCKQFPEVGFSRRVATEVELGDGQVLPSWHEVRRALQGALKVGDRRLRVVLDAEDGPYHVQRCDIVRIRLKPALKELEGVVNATRTKVLESLSRCLRRKWPGPRARASQAPAIGGVRSAIPNPVAIFGRGWNACLLMTLSAPSSRMHCF